MTLRSFLFDLDETLTDAQAGVKRAIEAVGDRFIQLMDGRVDRKRVMDEIWRVEIERSIRRSYDRDDWWREVAERLGLEPPEPAQLREFTLRYWENFNEWNRPFPDAEPTLNELRKRGYGLGLITDTDGMPGLKRSRMRGMSILRFFEVVVIAGEDTPKPKPDPEPFLLAASKLGVHPSECVVVGDKPHTDIRGGKAAGMRTVRIFRRRWWDEEEADYTINSLSQLLELLPELASGMQNP